MTSQYNALLAEAKLKGSNLAKDYIPRLFKELVEVEKLDPYDAGERIKKDLVDTWARTTIYENLPEEAKQEAKVEAGKQSHKKVLEVSATNIGIESSTTNDHEPDTFGLGVVESQPEPEPEVPPQPERDDSIAEYDKLANEHNKTLEKLEGVETENEYLQNQLNELKIAVTELQKARPNIVQAADNSQKRNPNRGYWIKFDLTNIELTRPLINIMNRMKDRPKQFYVEVLGDDVVEVSETILR